MIFAQQPAILLLDTVDGLAAYTNAVLDLRRGHFNLQDPAYDPNELANVLDELWRNLDLVDDFVADNPIGFNSYELRQVRQWKKAYVGYALAFCDDGGRLLLSVSDRLVEPCGISREMLDMLSRRPTYEDPLGLSIALIPFAGRITYPAVFSELPLGWGDGMRKALAEELRHLVETQPVISDAATFMEEVPRMLAEEAEHAAREALEDLEYELNPPEQPVGTHRGVLAGLDIKERERAIDIYIDTKPFDLLDEEGAEPQLHIITLMEEQRVAGKPDQPLDRLLSRLRVDQVRHIALQLQVPYARDLKKAELVEAIVEALADSTRVREALFGLNEMRARQLKRIVESGFSITLSVDELIDRTTRLLPCPPWAFAFKTGTSYTFTVPVELRAALESAPLDEIIANGETEMRICRLANMYAELRGIVSEDELIDEVAAQDLGTGYAELFARHAKRRAVEALLGVNFESDLLDSDILDDGKARWYIFHTLSDDAGTAPDDPWAAPAVVKAPLPPMLQNLLKARQSKPVRHLQPEMAECNTLYDWVLTLPEVQKLIGFLDANVPDDADDYFYADNVYETLEEMSRGGYPPNAVLEYVSDEEIIPDKASLKPFLDILMDFLNAMPNWANNGWAPNDILREELQN